MPWLPAQCIALGPWGYSMNRDILKDWVVEALQALGGRGRVLEVSKRVWLLHEEDLKAAGDLFFTWQYDIRWAAQKLRDEGRLKAVADDRAQPWELA